MSNLIRKLSLLSLGAGIAMGVTWDGQSGSIPDISLVPSAEARVGLPATPVSYAGVARRTTRRTVAVGAAAAATPPPPPPPPPSTTVVVVQQPAPCVPEVDANGVVIKPCP
jgi:hypothetical protein